MNKTFIFALIMAVLSATAIYAVPTEDCEKPLEELRLETQLKSRFSSLHGKASMSYGRGYREAKYILERAVRDSNHTSDYNAADDLERAIRSAKNECEDVADKFVVMLDILSLSTRDMYNSGDKVAILRGGIIFLTQNSPTLMTRDILLLGLSMTAPSLSSYSVAANVFDVVINQAKKAAIKDNKKEWNSLLSFIDRATSDIYHFQSKYTVQSKVARAIVEARPNQAVYLKALALISAMDLNNSYDQVNILDTGLKEYSASVPFENHKEVTRFMISAGGEIYNSSDKVSMYRSVMANLVGLDTKTPAAKVVLRAGMQMSRCNALSNMDSANVAEKAIRHALRLKLPPFVQRTLRDGLSEANRTYDSARKARILRDYMERALR